MKSVERLLLVAGLSMSLGACALADVASGPAPNVYVLTAARSEPGEDVGATSSQILVDEFSSSSVVDTSRILFQPSANEIQYYADARWSDNAPKMIQGLLVDTLQNTGRFAAVAKTGSELRGDYILMGDIRTFAALSEGSATNVNISLLVRLVRDSDRTILASKSFDARVAPMGSGMKPVVAAYDAALRQVLDEISLWSLGETAKLAPAAIAAPSMPTSAPDATPKPADPMHEDDEPL